MYRNDNMDFQKWKESKREKESKDRREQTLVYWGGKCVSCGETNHAFLLVANTPDGHGIEIICGNCLMRRRRPKGIKETFLKVLDVYGHQCNCCGERRENTLTLDHIRKDGGIERIAMSSEKILMKAIREADRTKYQVLCWSCNLARQLYGRCPHMFK